jgi:hypothetical protein
MRRYALGVLGVACLLIVATSLSASNPTPQLRIASAEPDYGKGKVYLKGANFPTLPQPLVVTINGQVISDALATSDTAIVGTLPAGLLAGSYLPALLGLEWSALDLRAGHIRLMTGENCAAGLRAVVEDGHRRTGAVP